MGYHRVFFDDECDPFVAAELRLQRRGDLHRHPAARADNSAIQDKIYPMFWKQVQFHQRPATVITEQV